MQKIISKNLPKNLNHEEQRMTTYQHILVPIDESPISYAAVEQALALAKSLNSQVTIMSVIIQVLIN